MTTTGLSRWERNRRTKRLPDIESPLLSIPEACAYLKLARSVIYERLSEFDQVLLGRRRFITKSSADNYLLRNTRLAKPAPPKRRELTGPVGAS